jgi:transcriptional regulator with XRE-family HTH domain
MLMEVNDMNSRNKIAQLRRKRGLTQARLCVMSGLHPSTISRIETGVIKGGPRLRRKIAHALKAKVSEIFPEAEDGRG